MSDDDKTMGVGRDDYDERRQARIDRLHEKAGRVRAEADGSYERSREVVGRIPAGQPVLVGHHSEKRHRRDLAKSDAAMRKSIAQAKEAASLADAAKAAERNRAVSGDDPEALLKLRAKYTAMEVERDTIKELNRRCRKGDEAAIAEVKRRHPMWAACGDDPHDGLPGYVLKNHAANMRRVKARIEELGKRAARVARERVVGDWTIRENPETNRVELDAGRRATDDEYTALKGRGFRWSRTNGVWQRQATESAWTTAVYLVEGFSKGTASHG
jgi:hypothetical protein